MTNGSNIYLQICSFNNVNNLIPDYFSFISLGLRMMVNTLLASMKMLWDVLILTMFFICIFALVGMQVFVGVLRNKCAEPVPDNLQTSYIDYVSNSSEWLMSRLLFLFIVHSTLVNLLSVTEYVEWILQTTTVHANSPHMHHSRMSMNGARIIHRFKHWTIVKPIGNTFLNSPRQLLT